MSILEDDDTLKDIIKQGLKRNEEKWKDIIFHNISYRSLAELVIDIEGEGQNFLIWTNKFVYYFYHSEDGLEIESVPRNPPEKDNDKS